MKASVYNLKGEEAGTTILPKELFEVPLNSDLIHQVVVSQMAKRRKPIAKAKDRSEVKGGGRKPWRQKGTGRARHGSIRSPLWRGGGVTFGPTKDRGFKKKINTKMTRKALLMVLSAKAKSGSILVLDDLSLKEAKTKLMVDVLKALKLEESVLIVLSKVKEQVIKAAKNLPKADTIEARNLNALDLLSYKNLIIEKETIKVIKETFLK